MKHYIYYDNHGKITGTGTANLATITANQGGFFVAILPELLKNPDNYYYQNGLIKKPAKPSGNYQFDYVTKTWVDLYTLDELKTQKWEQVKQQRDILLSKILFNGVWFSSDAVSQQHLALAIQSGQDAVWTSLDNQQIAMTNEQLRNLYQAIAEQTQAIHAKSQQLRQMIENAKDKNMLANINILE